MQMTAFNILHLDHYLSYGLRILRYQFGRVCSQKKSALHFVNFDFIFNTVKPDNMTTYHGAQLNIIAD